MNANLPPGCTQQMCDEALLGSWGEYDDDPREDDCDHDDFEIDWAGRAQCYRCGHSWEASREQVAAQERHQREYQEWVAQQERPWFRFKEWVKDRLLHWRGSRWRRKAPVLDDEIPF